MNFPTTEEVLLRETQDIVLGWKAAVKRNREGWEAINEADKKAGWLSIFAHRILPPPLPPPLPVRVKIIAERMGWLP